MRRLDQEHYTSVIDHHRQFEPELLRADDERVVSFPIAKYPLLANASEKLLEKITLRLDGRALRWEDLDEDIGSTTRCLDGSRGPKLLRLNLQVNQPRCLNNSRVMSSCAGAGAEKRAISDRRV